jgi:hypothetical protein
MKHTKGEWVAIKAKSASNVWTIKNITGDYVGLFSGEVKRPALMKEAIRQSEANAKLIAAAPDLLEALQAAKDYFDVCDKNCIPLDLQRQIKSAIKKATE